MNLQMAIQQSHRCQQPLSIIQAAELNAEKSRVGAELDCLRGLEPQQKNEVYMNAYGRMYERLEKCAYLERIST